MSLPAPNRPGVHVAKPTARRLEAFTKLLDEIGFLDLIDQALAKGAKSARPAFEPGKPRVYTNAGDAVDVEGGAEPEPDMGSAGELLAEMMQGAIGSILRQLIAGGRLGDLAEIVCELPEGTDPGDVDVTVIAEAIGPFVQALVRLTGALLSFAGGSVSAPLASAKAPSTKGTPTRP